MEATNSKRAYLPDFYFVQNTSPPDKHHTSG